MTGEMPDPFPTTDWTAIWNVRSGDETSGPTALGELLGQYWRPVYCYLRCHGHGPEAAKDLTQGFFCEMVLGHGLIEKADRARGKFRTFLLACLNRYVSNVQRAKKARQRMPEGGLLLLNEISQAQVPKAVQFAAPDEAFDYAWASALLDEVLADVRTRCSERGNVHHWQLFRDRVLLPSMHNSAPPSLAQLCHKYGIADKAKVSNMVFIVKRCFRSVLRRHVRQFVSSDVEVDEEISHLLKVFSTRPAIF